jgi:hypothetical protein
MPVPAWTRNKTKYKKYPQPNGSVNVVHFSPGRPRVTVRVPKSEAHNVPAYLKKHFNKPSNIEVLKSNNGTVRVVKKSGTSQISMPLPLKNPTNENINLFINSYLGQKASMNMGHFTLTGEKVSRRANFFQNSTNNGRTGTALTSLNSKGGLRTVYNVSKGKKSVRLGVAKLGAGEQAVVYLGYRDKAATQPVSLKVFPHDREFTKQPAEIEFLIGQKLHQCVPRHVPKFIAIEKVFEFVDPRNLARLTGPMNKRMQTVVLSEYFHGGDFRTWITKVSSRMKEEDLVDIIRQVLGTLVSIQDKYPYFRHNDLHTGNVFIDDTGVRPRAAIADFGLSRLTPELSSPIVNKGVFIKNGIGPNTNSRYDAHMFLNSLRPLATQFPKLRTYLNVVIPVGYRGKDDTYIKDGRLKYELPNYPGLPSTRAMFRMLVPFVKEKNLANAIAKKVPLKFSSANLQRAKAALRPVPKKMPFTSANLQRVKVLLKPVPKGTDAANIASAALANMPGVTVSKAPLSAANFLKLTPKSRQAYLASKQPAAKKPAVLQFKKTAGNLTAAKKTNAMAHMKLMKKSPNYELNKFFKTPVASLRPAKNILNSYNNVSSMTTRNLRKVLESHGYNAVRAKTNAKAWAKNWVNRVGARRANLKLTKGPNGRVRTGARLLEGLKREQLVSMAKKHGLTHSGKTKAQLINSLWKS